MTRLGPILTREVLTPVASRVKNPFSSSLTLVEEFLKTNGYDEYYYSHWPKVKTLLAQRALHLGSCNGQTIRSLAAKAPHHEVEHAILSLYKLIDQCTYYTSQCWRAFCYWLDRGTLNPRWPQFCAEEARTFFSLLPQEKIKHARELAQETWPDLSSDARAFDLVFKKIQTQIKRLCWKRLRYLCEYDAIYAGQGTSGDDRMEDLVQEINLSVLSSLRCTDHYSDKPEKMIGYAIRCADNAIHSLRDYANADQRARIKRVGKTKDGDDIFLLRESPLSQPLDAGENDSTGIVTTLADSIKLLGYGDGPAAVGAALAQQEEELCEATCLQQLLRKASDPRIRRYLEILWGGDYDEQFWEWFYLEEPRIAECSPHLTEENPELIGTWVQRWLKLGKNEIVDFLRQQIPELLEAVKGSEQQKLRGIA